MANRWFDQFRFSLEKNVVELYLKVSIGGSGAPTMDSTQSKGITSITRNSAGDYTVVMQDNYYRLLDFSVNQQNATGIPNAPVVGLKANSVTSGSFEFVTSVGGVATDPSSGNTLYIRVALSNSSAI